VKQTLWVATRKGLFALKGSAGFRIDAPAFLGDPVTMVLDDLRDGAVYAALNLGHFGVKLHRSTDRGASWQECAVPSYADVPPQSAPADADAPAPQPPTLKMLWALESGGADQPGRLWAGTLPGGLFRSDDGGQHWELVRSLWDRPERANWFGGGYDWPGIHSVFIDPRHSTHVFVGVSCGGAWASADDGATWHPRARGMVAEYMPPERRDDESIQDPHRISVCSARPEVMWTQHHNGVFRSENGGRDWKSVPAARPSAFGFAVAAHPTDPATAWFAPAVKDERRVPVDAKLVVSRTRDGGQSFDVLDRGLPAPSFDLVYRHALDVDRTGSVLAMGSTTGGLWLSEDGGDSWRTLSVNLPPVYAVRFGA
jgi:hypothetical protein